MPPAKHARTLAAIFATPTPANVRWPDVETLLRAHGATITEGAGSRVRVELNGVRAVFHRPHPRPEVDKGALVALRQFLEKAGMTP